MPPSERALPGVVRGGPPFSRDNTRDIMGVWRSIRFRSG